VYHTDYTFNVISPSMFLTTGLRQTIWQIELESWFRGRFSASAQGYILNEPMEKATNSP
jgi:hypothetical protein